jgi:hypothetical protein
MLPSGRGRNTRRWSVTTEQRRRLAAGLGDGQLESDRKGQRCAAEADDFRVIVVFTEMAEHESRRRTIGLRMKPQATSLERWPRRPMTRCLTDHGKDPPLSMSRSWFDSDEQLRTGKMKATEGNGRDR